MNTDVATPGQNETTPKAPDRPAFIGTRLRSEVVRLDYPLSYDGYIYDAIEVRRMTVQELAEFVETMATSGDEGARFPIFFRLDGERVPAAVLNALDLDDDDKLIETTKRFLGRRFRGDDGNTQAPGPGEA